jgi:hypothetical protein
MQFDSILSSHDDMTGSASIQETNRDESALVGNRLIQIRRSFDPNSERDWCEVVRDIVAIANSGGGQVVLDGSTSEEKVHQWLNLYTDSAFADVRIAPLEGNNSTGTVILIGRAKLPVGFTRTSICLTSAGEQGEIFTAGSFYFWHDDRSEPGTTADMRAFLERTLRRIRRRWLRKIRRVVDAPIDLGESATSNRAAAKRKQRQLANLQPVRIVTDPEAPALQPQDVDRLYPWRQKDLLRELNSRLGRRALNSYDIQAVRRQNRLDEHPDFVFNLPGAGRRYSPAAAEWIMDQYARDPEFFHRARAADQQALKLRRQKPK